LLKNPEKAAEFLRERLPKDYARPSDDDLKASTNPEIEKARTYFKFVEKKLGEEGEEIVEPIAPIGFLNDLRCDSKIFEWAGVSFGEYETMLLQKNLQKHIAACGAT